MSTNRGVPVWPCSTVMHVSVTVRELPLLEKVVLDCSLQQGHNNIPPFYFFACDITAGQVGGQQQKYFSPLSSRN